MNHTSSSNLDKQRSTTKSTALASVGDVWLYSHVTIDMVWCTISSAFHYADNSAITCPGVTCRCQFYVPALHWSHIDYNINGFLHARTPADTVVYDFLNIPVERHGLGLNAIQDRPNGGNIATRYSMATLLQLVIVSSPRKCLLGYEIVALRKERFTCFRIAETHNWQVQTQYSTHTTKLKASIRRIQSSTHSRGNPTLPLSQFLTIWLYLSVSGLSATHIPHSNPFVMARGVTQLTTRERITIRVADL